MATMSAPGEKRQRSSDDGHSPPGGPFAPPCLSIGIGAGLLSSSVVTLLGSAASSASGPNEPHAASAATQRGEADDATRHRHAKRARGAESPGRATARPRLASVPDAASAGALSSRLMASGDVGSGPGARARAGSAGSGSSDGTSASIVEAQRGITSSGMRDHLSSLVDAHRERVARVEAGAGGGGAAGAEHDIGLPLE